MHINPLKIEKWKVHIKQWNRGDTIFYLVPLRYGTSTGIFFLELLRIVLIPVPYGTQLFYIDFKKIYVTYVRTSNSLPNKR